MNTNINTIIALSSNGTPVYSHQEAHPHRIDLAAEAIAKMVIPASPADPADRSQTRHCEVIDFGRAIGVNHRTELKEGMRTFYMVREGHDYPSLMTIDGMPTIETKTTNVCFWDADNTRWVFWTNHEGIEDPYPEPGSDRFNRLSEAEQKKAAAWHAAHPLICTPAQIEQAKNEELIKTEWYFHVGEDDFPFSPTQQPWSLWEKNMGPYSTKEEANKQYKKYCASIKDKERMWAWPVHSRFEKTWHDEAKRKLIDLKYTVENRKDILARYEGTDKMQSLVKRIHDQLPQNIKEYEEMKIICG